MSQTLECAFKRSHTYIARSSHKRSSIEIDVLNNFAKLTRNTCARVSFSIKFRPATLIKKETLAQVFFCEFCENFKNTFFTDHLRWLILYWLTLLKQHTNFIYSVIRRFKDLLEEKEFLEASLSTLSIENVELR